MKKNDLPFEIGKDYENWEFDLDVIYNDTIPMYDSYLYVGTVKKFLNNLPDRTELIFHWDRLEIVILTFLHLEINTINKFKENLNLIPLKFKTMVKSDHELCFYSNENTQYYLVWQKPDTLVLIYGNANVQNKIYSIVLEKNYRIKRHPFRHTLKHKSHKTLYLT